MISSMFDRTFVSLICIIGLTTMGGLLTSCAKSSKTERLITESGLDGYVFRALNVDFEFEYKALDYRILTDESKELVEQWRISVPADDLIAVARVIENSTSNTCQVTTRLPRNGAVDGGSEKKSVYKCRVKLHEKQMALFASFWSDSEVVTVAIRHLILTGIL